MALIVVTNAKENVLSYLRSKKDLVKNICFLLNSFCNLLINLRGLIKAIRYRTNDNKLDN